MSLRTSNSPRIFGCLVLSDRICPLRKLICPVQLSPKIQKITCKLRSSILALKVDNLRSYSWAENKGVVFVPFSYFKVWVARNASIASLFDESSLVCKKNYRNLKVTKSQKSFQYYPVSIKENKIMSPTLRIYCNRALSFFRLFEFLNWFKAGVLMHLRLNFWPDQPGRNQMYPKLNKVNTVL